MLAQQHPNLILTQKGVAAIKASLGKAPLFDSALAKAKSRSKCRNSLGIQVPVPKDMSGGYTHERHKQNWFIAAKSRGALSNNRR